MNSTQVESSLRWLLSTSGPIGALLLYLGLPDNYLGNITELILALVAAVPPLTALVLALRAHTDSNNIAAVEAIPEVNRVVINANATGSTKEAAQDPARPKVVTD